MKLLFKLILLCSIVLSCKNTKTGFNEILANSPHIEGNTEYLDSPYVTAGNRVYMVGHQDGSFPDLGWHIKGEMGGIWNHPIKLMDGFAVEIADGLDTFKLDKAKSFTNYPFANKHTFFWKEKNIEIERWQYVPDDKQGIIVQLVLKNKGAERKVKVKFTGKTDLRPTWLGERTDMIDGKDQATYDIENQIWKVKDSLNDWYTVFGSQLEFDQDTQANEIPVLNNTTVNSIEDVVFLFSDNTQILNYVIAGSYTSEKDALDTYTHLKNHINSNLISKRERYEILATQSKLTVPDQKIQQTFEWLKYNCDWLVRTVPEIGSGITAGIPDYPWWFGVDSEYALKGYMAIGQRKAVHNTISLLDSLSNATNGNGRIVHEVSTNGAVFNPGNINETPQFASLIWEIYKWNGDKEFLKMYFPTIKKGLEWLMTEKDSNKNLFPDGFGMMEIHGLNSEMIDVASYTQRAFDDAAKIATELGNHVLSNEYKNKADRIKEKINSEFWSEEFNSYADFIGTDTQALHLIEDAIIRADTLKKPWAVRELKQTKASILNNPSTEPRPFVLHHNWVVNTPMEMNIAEKEKALKALKTAETFVNPFGVFVTGIDRDESAGSDDGSFEGSKAFSYTGAVMTLPTGVQAVAENNYGRPNQALNYLKRLSRSFSFAFPGSMYEVSPDYGMITQAWNIYGFAIPIVQQFFGINPLASRQKVYIKPQMPDEWNKASLENVIISDNAVSVFYDKSNGFLKLKVAQENPNWELEVILPKNEDGVTFTVIESSAQYKIYDNQIIFNSKASTIELLLQYK